MESRSATGAGEVSTRRRRSNALASALVVWSLWAAATASALLFIRYYSRNVPYFDDFTVVAVMTGHRPVTYQWVTAQYNEHRNVVPRLLQVLLLRAIPDFRAGLYLNAGLLSAAAASAIVLARRLRGETRVVDGVLPLAILSLGQCECLLVGFALNLVLTACIAWRLIGVIGHSARPPGWWACLRVGATLALLPLCGGSGMAMVPPLMLWLAGHVAVGWWSGRDPGPWVRGIGLALLMTASAVVAWYLTGYVRPPHIPPPPSVSAIAATTLEVCGLLVEPVGWTYWRVAGLAVLMLAAATAVLLATTAWRLPDERPRAFGLMAMMSSILVVALSVGYSRSGIGPGNGWCSRYITIAMPLLGVVYFAWLLYGRSAGRRAIHIGLLVIVCAGIPAQLQFARDIGAGRRLALTRIERALVRGLPCSRVVDLAHPDLFSEPEKLRECFQMLKEAGVGKFANMGDDRLAIEPDARATVR